MPSDATNLLRLENLSARIGRQVVLHDISLNVGRGECLAIVGGSGAGKSTLLRCLLGLRRPARPFEGQLYFDRQEIDFSFSNMKTRPQGIGYVPQNPDQGFDPLKRLKWQWGQAARVVTGRAETSEAQTQLLQELGLKPFEKCFPHQWSRGMQQRLLLAMALMGEPCLLVLDEPTSALDPLIAAQVLRAVVKHAAMHDVAVLIVTHDLSLAARYADRTVVMNAGRVTECGETVSLLKDPQSDYGRLLVKHRDWMALEGAQSSRTIAAE